MFLAHLENKLSLSAVVKVGQVCFTVNSLCCDVFTVNILLMNQIMQIHWMFFSKCCFILQFLH